MIPKKDGIRTLKTYLMTFVGQKSKKKCLEVNGTWPSSERKEKNVMIRDVILEHRETTKKWQFSYDITNDNCLTYYESRNSIYI